jgi:UV DNA damage repair endonuclease
MGEPKDRGNDGRFAWNQGPPPEQLGDEELVTRFGQVCVDFALASADPAETAAANEMAKVKAKCRKVLVERLWDLRFRATAAEKIVAERDQKLLEGL